MRAGPYRFFCYASDGKEPVHVHVERDSNVAKYWLIPVRLQSAGGFSRVELARIEALVRQHEPYLRESWNAFFRR
jgi:hypothetical protein